MQKHHKLQRVLFSNRFHCLTVRTAVVIKHGEIHKEEGVDAVQDDHRLFYQSLTEHELSVDAIKDIDREDNATQRRGKLIVVTRTPAPSVREAARAGSRGRVAVKSPGDTRHVLLSRIDPDGSYKPTNYPGTYSLEQTQVSR